MLRYFHNLSSKRKVCAKMAQNDDVTLLFSLLCPTCLLAGLHWEAEGGDPGCGDRGVGLGLHPPHGHHRQHDACWSGWEVWPTQHRRPDHDHQWDEPGGFTAQHLPEHHQGTLLLLKWQFFYFLFPLLLNLNLRISFVTITMWFSWLETLHLVPLYVIVF